MRAEAVELYSGLLQVLAPGERIAPCMRGLIAPPELLDLTAPPDSIGFPPALIPVWDKGSGPKFYGYWRHWFVPRQPTFVEYNLDASEVYEWGRTFLQLVGGLVLRDVEVNDGLTGEARRFLESVGFPDLEGFEELLANGGDHPSILAEHVVFRDDPPLIVFEFGGEYGGDFPNPRDRASWRYASSLELEVDSLVGEMPSTRLVTPNPKEEFERCLKDGDLGSAWLALNCRGWLFAEASIAIQELSRRAGDPVFADLARAWVVENGDVGSGY